jgi:FMN-dependent NADH-azoreductase
MSSFDHMEGYLRAIFGFVGITDLTFFNVQPCDISSEVRNVAAKATIAEVRAWVGASSWGDDAEDLPA